MPRFLNNRALSLISAMATFALTIPAQAGFCGNYIQTASNAGHCATCKLRIADNPEIQKYFVTANNGWSAELTWNHGDSSTASGSGKWKANVGHVYANRKFDIDMNQQGRTLRMTMSTSINGNTNVIKARYKCLGF